MPLSPERKQQSQDRLLELMLDQLGDHYANSHQGVFSMIDPKFSGIPNSIWSELRDEGLLTPDDTLGTGAERYLFTTKGWLHANMRLGRTAQGGEFHARLCRVLAALKEPMKETSRSDDLRERWDVIAEAANVPSDFVANAIDCSAIEIILGRRGGKWHGTTLKKWIRIPRNVGDRLER